MSPGSTVSPRRPLKPVVMTNPSPPAPVRLEGVVKEYRDFTLGPINLELEPGYITALIGRNGAGKTTLLRLIMGMARPTRGRITVFGLSYADNHHRILSRIGFVPEEPFLYDEMDVAWIGRFVSRLYPGWDQDEFRRLLAHFDVPARKQIKELSKGSRVKAELALALAHHPDLLILDEPTSGLDPIVRREVLEELQAVIARSDRATVLFSTHITEDVERIADRVAFLVEGRLALLATQDELREKWMELWLDENARPLHELTALPEVFAAEPAGAGTIRVITRDAPATLKICHTSAIRKRPLAFDEILGLLSAGKNSQRKEMW
ncbi:MAG: ABC transporter ATP-binding protein [Limnochordales bacterium]|nr:ABC transporter ATP-binding protein [Limnochordales bacterium]